MKPLYSTPIAFRPMNPQPKYNGRPFQIEGDKTGNWYQTNPNYPHGDLLSYAWKPPYRPGEKCYVPEAWKVDRIEDDLVIRYKSDNAVICIHESNDSDVLALIDHKLNPWSWRSPVTMPAWAARRFVTILSCEPVRVSEVTDRDARLAGFPKELQYRGGDDDPSHTGGLINYWHKRHPGKEWAWRVVSEE